jgi:hypothetical protein
MIKSVKVTNHLGEFTTLELRRPESSGFFVRGGISGLGPAKATINNTEIASMDGSLHNSARVNQRNIVFSLGFLVTPTIPTIEDARHLSYKYFPIKRRIGLEIETDVRICETYGYVESNEPDIFSKEEGTTISVICPDSYFYSVYKNVTLFNGSNPLFEFPFSNESLTDKLLVMSEITTNTEQSIYYTGDAPVGMMIFIHAIGNASNPRIFNTLTREEITIDTSRMPGGSILEGDNIYISTTKGDKFIMLERNGVLTNILNTLGMGISWFQLEKGNNLFAYTASEGGSNLFFRIENRIAFEGI